MSEQNNRDERDSQGRPKANDRKPPQRKSYNDRQSSPSRPARDGDRRSFSGDRDRKPFSGGGDRDSRKPYAGGAGRDERKSYGDRPARDGERKPFSNDRDSRKPFSGNRDERKSYGDRPARDGERRSFGSDRDSRKPFGSDRSDRKPYAGRDDRERKPFGDRPARDGQRKPFSSDRDSRKPFAGRDDRGDRKPYAAGGGRDERKPFGDRPARDGERRSFGNDRDSRKPFSGNRDDRKPYAGGAGRDDRERKPFGDRPARDGERKPFSNDRGDRKPFAARDDRGPRKPFSGGAGRDERKPFGDRPSRDGDRRSFSGDRDRKPFSGNRDDRKPFSGGAGRDGERKPFRKDSDRRPSSDRPFRSDDRPRSSGPRNNDRPRSAEETPVTERKHNARDLRSANRADRERSPEIDDDVTGQELDKVTRAQLRNLEEVNGEWVSKHLVMAGRLIDTDPELAFQHALAASRRGGRMAAVREAVALTAYAAGEFGDALREFRTHRRISGSNEYLAMMADCERGLGRPDRALDLARSEDVSDMDTAGKVDMAIVASGARMDMEQFDAAVHALEIPQLDKNRAFSYSPRLFRAYADALELAGRGNEAEPWRRQALLAESVLGLGEFAEPEIMDLGDDDDEAPAKPRFRRDNAETGAAAEESAEDRSGNYAQVPETAVPDSEEDESDDALPGDAQESLLGVEEAEESDEAEDAEDADSGEQDRLDTAGHHD
ncbi:hypothetical protein H9639_00010 [Arthrobacter sp. Sa2CUA1]|uniref:Primosomal protein n=1 Tax=Arthrobacter gallicola TaxID=2762225 RepID=A0ABR8UNI0_9MICC|nr:hypothetical protein [Arthrobacter gallicola]MBD7993691.1 hypothetical protein [Arthrobacter gallicola]